jgi:endonuclease V-like protein UPF0215 family
VFDVFAFAFYLKTFSLYLKKSLSKPTMFRVIKPEIRVLGIDDGRFTPRTEGSVLVVGVVFRGGYSIEGVMHTHVAIDGLDSTEKLVSMINRSPHRRQLRLLMLNGITFAGFNLVDIKKLNAAIELPVLAITNEKPDLDKIHAALRNLPCNEERWRIVLEAGKIHKMTNKDSKIYLELAGISLADAKKIIRLTSTRSSLPEPLRVAHLIASGISP